MKVVIKNWIEVNDLSSGQHSVNKNIRPKNSMFRSDLCDYSDTYIVIKGGITVEGDNGAKKETKSWSSKKMLHLDHSYQDQWVIYWQFRTSIYYTHI